MDSARPDIRAERIRLGLTLPKFADAVGVPYDTAWRAQRGGAVREDYAKALGDFFGVDPIVFVEPDRAAA
jgi:hypothetical protein